MKKKLSIMALASTLAVTTVVPATLAGAESIKPAAEERVLVEQEVYEPVSNIELNGVNFVADFEMTQEHAEWLYAQITEGLTTPVEFGAFSPETEIGTFSLDNGGAGAINVTTPTYKTFTNVEARFLITAVGTWVSLVNPHITKTLAINLAGGVFYLTDVGTWSYKAYDSTYKRYRLYTTIVHYKHSNYSTPITVQVQDLGFE